MKLEFLDSFSKDAEISNFMKIRPVGAELFWRLSFVGNSLVTVSTK
jgi:hypothetical protein